MLTDLTLLLVTLSIAGAFGIGMYILYALTQLPRYFMGRR